MQSAAATEGLVSVVTPTYGDVEYLDRAVESALAQTYTDVEVIVVDSSPGRAARAVADARDGVRYLHREPRGPGAARNAGIDAANGEFVAFLDADDEWLPEKLDRQVEALGASDAEFAFCEEFRVSDGERRHVPGFDPDESDEDPHVAFFADGPIGSRTVLVRRACLDRHRFDESLMAHEDRHLWVRLLRDYDLVKVREPLAVKHIREDSLTADPEMVFQNECRAVTDLCDRFPELAPHRAPRLRGARLRCAKHQLLGTDRHAARQKLRAVWDNAPDAEVAVLLALTYLPVGNRPAFDFLSAVEERLPV